MSDNAAFDMIGYIIGLIIGLVSFIATIAWMIIRGKVREDIHSIWTNRMKEYDDKKESEREFRRQSYLNDIASIRETIKSDKEDRKEDREESIDLLKNINNKLSQISDMQIRQEVRIDAIEKKKG